MINEDGMTKVSFITKQGERIDAIGDSGNLMELARDFEVDGIEGDCGGVCSCATCHVHLREQDFQKLDPPSDIEMGMLEFDEQVTEFSRLGCQIAVDESIEGMVFRVAN